MALKTDTSGSANGDKWLYGTVIFIMENGEKVYIRKGGVKKAAEASAAWLMDAVRKDEL